MIKIRVLGICRPESFIPDHVCVHVGRGIGPDVAWFEDNGGGEMTVTLWEPYELVYTGTANDKRLKAKHASE